MNLTIHAEIARRVEMGYPLSRGDLESIAIIAVSETVRECALIAWEHARDIRKARHSGTRCDEIAEDIRARFGVTP